MVGTGEPIKVSRFSGGDADTRLVGECARKYIFEI
jgi:hypothetical protein